MAFSNACKSRIVEAAMIIPQNHKRRGISLVELSLVFCIVGIVIGGVWVYMNSASQSSRVEQAVEAISLTVDSTRAAYGGKAAIAGGVATVMPYLVSTGSLPENLML